jgi:hypothetical protein
MSLQNAKENINRLAEALQIPHPDLGKEHSCALFAKEGFSIHFQYDEKIDKLTLLVPLLESLPSTDKGRAKLYSTLLEAELAYAQIPIGRIGLSRENELLLFHESLSMEEPDDTKVLSLLPPFLEMAQTWKEVVTLGQKTDEPTPKGMRI